MYIALHCTFFMWGGGWGCLFEAGHLVTFLAIRVGAYSRGCLFEGVLIQGGAYLRLGVLNQINTVNYHTNNKTNKLFCFKTNNDIETKFYIYEQFCTCSPYIIWGNLFQRCPDLFRDVWTPLKVS